MKNRREEVIKSEDWLGQCNTPLIGNLRRENWRVEITFKNKEMKRFSQHNQCKESLQGTSGEISEHIRGNFRERRTIKRAVDLDMELEGNGAVLSNPWGKRISSQGTNTTVTQCRQPTAQNSPSGPIFWEIPGRRAPLKWGNKQGRGRWEPGSRTLGEREGHRDPCVGRASAHSCSQCWTPGRLGAGGGPTWCITATWRVCRGVNSPLGILKRVNYNYIEIQASKKVRLWLIPGNY